MPPRKRNNEDPLEKMIRDSVAETGHFPSLIVKIIGLKFDIDINEEAYDQDKRREIREFVREMSKEIWIDKTYVDFGHIPQPGIWFMAGASIHLPF